MHHRLHGLSAAAFLCLTLLACGGSDPSASADATSDLRRRIAITISPTQATSAPNATSQYKATVTGTWNTGVTWSVKEAGGGTVSSSGLYTAPNAPGVYHVVATSAAYSAVSTTATVTVQSGASYALAVNVSGSGSIQCNSGSCASSYPSGTALTITATPASGFTFSSWGGDCSGSTCALTMNANHSVTATFTATPTPTPSTSLVTWSSGYWDKSWMPIDQIAWSTYNQINIVEIEINGAGGFDWIHTQDAATVTNPALTTAVVNTMHSHNKRAVMLVGDGWHGGASWATIAASASLRTTLINNIVKHLSTFDYDGVEIDWENMDTQKTPMDQYTALFSQLRSALDAVPGRHRLLNMSGGSWIVPWEAAVIGYVDQLNVMSYYQTASEMPGYMNGMLSAGIPKSKIAIGFGLDAADGAPADPEVDVTTTECQAKMQFILSNGYAGAMVWGMGKSPYAEPVIAPHVP